MSDPRASRGYRNRNPGNIDHVPTNRWQGLADPPLEPPPRGGGRARFARFVSHEYGIRALAMLLTTYQDRHGLRTIAGIVDRWAPGSENDTEAYVRHVARLTGRDPNDRLDLHTHADLRPLVQAIITHELGGNPYDDRTIDDGLRLAGVPRPVETLRQAAATGTGRAAAGTAAAGVGALAVVEAVQQMAPHVAALGAIAERIGPWAAAIALAAAAAWFLWQRRARAT